MSKPNEATFCVIFSGVSSNAISTPGSLYSSAPRTRNSIPNMVFPQPGPPQTIDVRPFGRPPSLISSNPGIPVGVFSSPERSRRLRFVLCNIRRQLHVEAYRAKANTNGLAQKSETVLLSGILAIQEML